MKSKYGFYKAATGCFYTHIADIEKNKEETISLIQKAVKEEVQILLFPELSLTGYTAQDLLLSSSLAEESFKAAKEIASYVPDSMLVFIGLPLRLNSRLYNVAAALNNGKIVGIVPKTYLPNSGEFYERRYFSSSLESEEKEVLIDEEVIPFGTDLIFSFGECKVACEICEDLWAMNPPSNDYCLLGANCIVNLSASNDLIGKKEYRRELVKMQSAKNYCAYLYSSSGEGESSQDLLFSSHQLFYVEGTPIFDLEETGLHIGIFDVERIENDRIKAKSIFSLASKKSPRIISLASSKVLDLLPEQVDAHPFYLKKEEEREKRSLEIFDYQVRALKTRFQNTGFQNAVIGVSGGLDSTLALLVLSEAFQRLSLPKENIFAYSLPSFATSKRTSSSSKKLCSLLSTSFIEISIKKQLEEHLKDIHHPFDVYDVTYENAQARIRTMILLDEANSKHALMIGTSDLSEAVLGFSTYNGDHMSNYGVNISVPKTLVRTIIKDIAKTRDDLKEVLEEITATPISPELIPGKKDEVSQKTEEILGSYELHDFFLYHFLRNGFPKEKIFALAKIAFPDKKEEEIRNTLNLFFTRFFQNQFKRSCLPDGVKIGSVAISPRGDLRLSSDIASFNTLNPAAKKK